MLEGEEARDEAKLLYRYANLTYVSAFAAMKGLRDEELVDVIRFMNEPILDEHMKGPFLPKMHLGGHFGGKTRFSDGNWPVYYGALEKLTAQMEVAHHYAQQAAESAGSDAPVHYSLVQCQFHGNAIDLRDKVERWPALVSEDYTFCQGLGYEAYEIGLGAFYSPSVRAVGGTSVPTFVAGMLSEAIVVTTVKFTFDEIGGNPVVEDLLSRAR